MSQPKMNIPYSHPYVLTIIDSGQASQTFGSARTLRSASPQTIVAISRAVHFSMFRIVGLIISTVGPLWVSYQWVRTPLA